MSEASSAAGPARWRPGASVLYQEVWADALLAARPMTVVADDGDLLALYSHPRAAYRSAAIGSARRGMTLDERVAVMVSSQERTYERRTAADLHVLVLAPDAQWHAVWLFWNTDWELLRWYVNLQQPLGRTERGVQIRDCALDLVVQPNRSWSWKDRDEFDALCRRGFFAEPVRVAVEAEAHRMIGVIERWGSPFRDGWERWRADPAWTPPPLPQDFDALER